MERRVPVHARAHRQALSAVLAAVVLAGAASPAVAAPKSPEAKAAFDRGVAAYTKGDFAAASAELEKSFVLEEDVETLFAWAQTERQLDRCDKAVLLYKKLLAAELPEENRAAIQTKLAECEAQAPAPAPDPVPAPDPAPAPVPVEPPPPMPEEGRAWWKDPIGGGLVGAGVIGVGLGTVFLMSARSADQDKDSAPTYGEFQRLEDRAESRGRIGVIATIAGVGLIAGGVVWYVTQKKTERPAQVTGWLSPDGGGLAAVGRF